MRKFGNPLKRCSKKSQAEQKGRKNPKAIITTEGGEKPGGRNKLGRTGGLGEGHDPLKKFGGKWWIWKKTISPKGEESSEPKGVGDRGGKREQSRPNPRGVRSCQERKSLRPKQT